ncbi:hypothetical protein ACELLULO517_15865 [Acidisoma cellulosilytica]|uniref:Uncharacterized protein n=1 Tax=Acidisoma cellulosilyticum TaxID=2802395 RepID=A0A963Z2T4_9PROT|nr:hypothetical protein [Acidisoma cellulosilyticum]MCB8881725.1 hypothetical protein [Acidisoma cellulosilyticum]
MHEKMTTADQILLMCQLAEYTLGIIANLADGEEVPAIPLIVSSFVASKLTGGATVH